MADILGVMDVGSNSIKARVVELGPGGVRSLAEMRYPVRLGRGTFSRGVILPEDMESALVAFRDFANRCQKLGAGRIRAVGTSALREAANAAELIARVQSETGIALRVISGTEEARLIAASAVAHMDSERHHLVVDIGGGSTEVIYTRADGRVTGAVSLRLGAVRLAQELGMPPRYTARHVAGLRERVGLALDTVSLPVAAPDTDCIGTGGTIRALMDLTRRWADDAAGEPALTRRLVERAITEMQDKTMPELIAGLGLDEKRAQILVAGAVILSELFKLYKVKRLVLRDCGVRDGLIQDSWHPHGRDELTTEQLGQWICEVGDKFSFEAAHGHQVGRLALRLFDGLQGRHGLGSSDRTALYVAGCLHDVGQYVSYSKHHKHSMYLLGNVEMPGELAAHQGVIALVARYHRKAMPGAGHAEFAALDDADQRRVRVMAALLRLADGLDRQHRQLVADVAVSSEGDDIVLEISAAENIELELQALDKKADLAREVFGGEVRANVTLVDAPAEARECAR